MKLNILISTIDEGIFQVSKILLPFREDVEYIISHQNRNEPFINIPSELQRKDVLISQISGQGLTKSRNNAIRHATGDVCVIADDDVTYTNLYFDTIINTYEKFAIDVACFKIYKDNSIVDYKFYPSEITTIKKMHEHPVSSIELTFKLQSVKKKNIFFDERFGMGSWLKGGGEILFMHDCISSGLLVKFFPEYIVNHPHECTITSYSKYHERRVRITGSMDMRLNGKIAYIKALPRTLKLLPDLIHERKNPFSYLKETLEGVHYIKNNSRRNS